MARGVGKGAKLWHVPGHINYCVGLIRAAAHTIPITSRMATATQQKPFSYSCSSARGKILGNWRRGMRGTRRGQGWLMAGGHNKDGSCWPGNYVHAKGSHLYARNALIIINTTDSNGGGILG